MDARASTSEPQHSFHPGSWSAATTPTVAPSASFIGTAHAPDGAPDAVISPAAAAASLQSHLELLPLLFPQQSNIYHAQLLHYNKLVSPTRGGGLQTPPLPPVVSAPHVHAGSRSRSSSKVSLKDVSAGKAAAVGGHGNKSQSNQDKSRSVMMSKDASHKIPAKQQAAESLASGPQRSTAASVSSAAQGLPQSSSVPSTPHQHARQFSFESRDPSPIVPTSHSPRSAYSETNSALPSLRPLPPRYGRCKYETAQMNSRRRIPYSVGNERLERLDPRTVKNKLSEDEERKLAADVREIFDGLLPTEAVEANRRKLVSKLEKIFNEEWPGHDIKVHLFGSSGNLLCSDDSDVDICITTSWNELEGVCMIADLLARRGMEKVVCISAAKVPIVKIWDPELGLACDMNVNNTLALENTRMVRTYVEADPRVRQLAMIIKYWTRRRIVNDAAFGGTLSSYTWICLIIAFLQLRSPPVLPALHQLPYKLTKSDGTTSDFADNLKKIRGFGNKNKSSVPELLFQFFRFYAHEFDYDTHVLSVRQGKLVTKAEKKWHYQINNQLCVEEPFNVSRNLGNTADEYAFRGLHLELRRAFDLISAAKLGEACEQYVYPKEEERVWTRPAQQSRPVLLRSSSQTQSGRGGRTGHRGGRHNGNFHRGGAGGGPGTSSAGSNRRASSGMPAYDNGLFMAPINMQQDIQWYQNPHFQFQYAQQDLMTQMAYHQESMRQLQLFSQTPGFLQHQALGQQRVPAVNGSGQQSSDRSRTNSFDNVPMNAQLRPDLYALYGMGLGHAFYPQAASAGYGTYPSSPVATGAAGQDFRRSMQRTTADGGVPASSSSLRSQSQPASRSPSATHAQTAFHRGSQTPTAATPYPPTNANGIPIPSFMSDDADFDETPKAVSDSPESSSDDGASAGFFEACKPSPTGSNSQPHGLSNAIAFGDISANPDTPVGARRSSAERPHPHADRKTQRLSRSPSPPGHWRNHAASTPMVHSLAGSHDTSRPLVVNGSCLKSGVMPGQQQKSRRESAESTEASLPSSQEQSPLSKGCMSFAPVAMDVPASQGLTMAPSPELTPDRLPMVVNGTNGHGITPTIHDDPSFRERIAYMATHHINAQGLMQEPTNNNVARFSPTTKQRWMPRQSANGIIAPLDLAMDDARVRKASAAESAHLSPVYETRASSPNASRHNDGVWTASKPDSRRASYFAGPEAGKGTLTPQERTLALLENDQSFKSSKFLGQVSKTALSHANGHVRGAKSESDGGWQKAGKGKKKMVNGAGQHNLGEQLPQHESERKGG
ncbi:hypothetical protein HIM_04661 [Hirsutella minnesotensis 3608]|uniref:polynucleotide adenylyltransferase n=1 Tax=Hirsutella minnesotensis 3608 TaxID=1043627 RepID=A0A0F8A137_9HYPO|nr:hypothetical protein HIM_04661 [Hirsutella minnesotensis 3608]